MIKRVLAGYGKKAQVEEMVDQIPYIILTIIVIVGIYALLNYATNPQIDVSEVQANTFVYRTLYSPNSISQTDSLSGRVHPGIIVDSNFTDEVLDATMKYSYEKQISAKLEIYFEEGKEPVRTAYYNKMWFDRLAPLAKAKLTGSGSAKSFEKTVPVVYRQPGADFPAFLKYIIIIPD